MTSAPREATPAPHKTTTTHALSLDWPLPAVEVTQPVRAQSVVAARIAGGRA